MSTGRILCKVMGAVLYKVLCGRLTCVKWKNCARDGRGAEGSVQPGKVGLVHPGDVPVVRHPEIKIISDLYHIRSKHKYIVIMSLS